MDLQLNDNERMFAAAVGQVVSSYLQPPRDGAVGLATHSAYSSALYVALGEGGFLDAAKEPDFGPVCAALLIEQAARSPLSVEVGASALVAGMTCKAPVLGPIALLQAKDLQRPIRYLTVAKTALVLSGDDLLAIPIDPANVERNAGMYAYPFGTFKQPPDLAQGKRVGDGRTGRLYWQIYVAVEGAALMQAALDYTVAYVKDRRQFNQPIGAFQAVKHRLAMDAQKVRGSIWLARRAAWSGLAADAAMAALYTQQAIPDVVYDCHQFNGAMGMTLECPLHFWTYRLKALQAELGGAGAQAGCLAKERWLS